MQTVAVLRSSNLNPSSVSDEGSPEMSLSFEDNYSFNCCQLGCILGWLAGCWVRDMEERRGTEE